MLFDKKRSFQNEDLVYKYLVYIMKSHPHKAANLADKLSVDANQPIDTYDDIRDVVSEIMPFSFYAETNAELCVGTLKDRYVRKVALPRAPPIQHASQASHVTRNTCYLAQVPHIPTWSDLTRSLAGLGRRALLPFPPLLV